MQEAAQKAVNGSSRVSMSSREQEVLNLLLEGNPSKEIASKLNISPRTVDYHRNNIYKKLDVHNYQELLAKYSSIKDKQENTETPVSAHTKFQQTEFEQSRTSKTKKLYKYIIPAAIIILFCLVVPLWYLTIKTSSSKFSKKTPSEPAFIDHTFEKIHLRVNRWEGLYGHGENWSSGNSIKLSDIFSGDVRNILRADNKLSYIKVSGNADKTLRNAEIHFHYFIDKKYWNADDYKYQWLHIGGGGICFDLPFVEIPQGEFEVIIPVKYNSHNDYLNVSAGLPQGDIYLQLNEEMYNVNLYNESHNFNFGKTPEEIPDYTVMTTIRNLKFELIEQEKIAAPVFIDRSFNKVYLRANRYSNDEQGFYGQSYDSYNAIKLRDFNVFENKIYY